MVVINNARPKATRQNQRSQFLIPPRPKSYAMSCLRTCVRKFARKYHINIKMPDSINIRTLSVIYLSVAVTMFTLTKVSIFLACSVRRECYATERLLLRSVPVRHEGVPVGPNLTLILNCD